VLSETTAVFFQTELRWPPPELFDFRVSRTMIRALFNKLFEPEFNEHAYQNLELEPVCPTLSKQTGTARALVQFDTLSMTIEESRSESHVDDFVKHVTQVLLAFRNVVVDLNIEVPDFFVQRCKIHCLAQPHNSPGALPLLAGGVANVFERIAPFERPPCHFGVRFRFPPAEIVTENGDAENTRTHRNYATVRFETYEGDPSRVWMEVASEYMLYPNEVSLRDTTKIAEHIHRSYEFLTQQCVQFLNQFDVERPDDDAQEAENDQ